MPDTGFEHLNFNFDELNEKVSDTVVDQFVQQAKNLQELIISGGDAIPEKDRQNVVELTSRLIEA